MNKDALSSEELITVKLRELYRSYGYSQYKVSKFEEYDLYMQNKRFLTSEQVLTFSDSDGKLMALKPDVTLSIVKNTKDDGSTSKLCYTEHVYRIPRGAYGFREILQTGLECIGNIDGYAVCEVLLLAARSLALISPRYLLDVSHMGIISGILAGEELEENQRSAIFAAFGEKNSGMLSQLCAQARLSPAGQSLLEQLITLYGPFAPTLEALCALPLPAACDEAVDGLRELAGVLALSPDIHVNLDFSVVNDMDYYNGIIFKGFIDTIPVGVLSGGRYDGLMARMGKHCGAIGFAVYLNELERFNERKRDYDVDTLILYDDRTDSMELINAAEQVRREGRSVRVQRENGGNVKYRQLIRLSGEEAQQ